MSRLNRALYVVALLLACGCAVGGVLTWQEHGDRVDAKEEQQRYGAVIASATDLATAFVNIDYRKLDESFDAVAAGSTGDFKKDYTNKTGDLTELITQQQSVSTGKVVWAGVVSLDQDSARVIAATEGTVANKPSGGKPFATYFRLQLDLQLVDGRWLTSDLEFVG
jgi:Mce-associated membrane protein